jgi:hypothetical protein
MELVSSVSETVSASIIRGGCNERHDCPLYLDTAPGALYLFPMGIVKMREKPNFL